MKLPKVNLLVKIIIAIILGIVAGMFFPDWLARVFATFNAFFSQFLGLCIPMIIIGFVAPAIADIGGKAGKMLVVTVLLAYVATLLAGTISYFTSDWLFPSMIDPSDANAVTTDGVKSPESYFTIQLPSPISVTSSLVVAFILGIGGAKRGTTTLNAVMSDFRKIIQLVIGGFIIPLLPLYIFGIFMDMSFTGQASSILVAFAKIIGVIFGLHIFILLLQYSIAAIFTRGTSRNPLRLLWTMMPAYFTALGTSSSAATIPVTLRQTIKMGVNEDIAGFTVPLCATIHMSGSTLKIVACAVALMIMHHMPYDAATFIGFICMLAVTIVAAPGVPGGVIMASLGILQSILGFSESDLALMIALYITMDSFGTACNITGDGALSIIVNRIFGKKEQKATAEQPAAPQMQ